MRRFIDLIFATLFKDPSDRISRFPKWFRWVVGLTAILFFANVYDFIRQSKFRFLPEIVTSDRVATVVGSLIGTLIGAWLAFFFASRGRTLTRVDEEVAAGNLALFTMSSLYNITKQHQTEVVLPYRTRADAWLNLPTTAPLNETFKFERKDLSFIATNEPNVFQELLLEEVRFEFLAFAIKHHRDLILNKVWPVLATRFNVGEQMPEDELRRLLGPALVKDLEVTTRGIIQNIDKNVISIEHAFKDLRGALKRIHPTRKFIDFQFPL